jgi:hypothetical protein
MLKLTQGWANVVELFEKLNDFLNDISPRLCVTLKKQVIRTRGAYEDMNMYDVLSETHACLSRAPDLKTPAYQMIPM